MDFFRDDVHPLWAQLWWGWVRLQVEDWPSGALWCSKTTQLGALKTVEMVVNPPAPITQCGSPFDSVETFLSLGTIITQELKWELNICSLTKTVRPRMCFLGAAEDPQPAKVNDGAPLHRHRRVHPQLLHQRLAHCCHCQGQGQTAAYHSLWWEADWLQSASRSLRRAGKIMADPSHPIPLWSWTLQNPPLWQEAKVDGKKKLNLTPQEQLLPYSSRPFQQASRHPQILTLHPTHPLWPSLHIMTPHTPTPMHKHTTISLCPSVLPVLCIKLTPRGK